MVVWGGITNSWEKKRNKGKGERERCTQLNAEIQRIARRVKKTLNEQCKEIKENNRVRKTRDFFKEIWTIKGPCHARIGTIKDRNGNDLTEAEETKKKWQEYTELYRKGLNDPNNHDDVVTFLELDILEYEVKWALGSRSMNKASGGDRILAALFKNPKRWCC